MPDRAARRLRDDSERGVSVARAAGLFYRLRRRSHAAICRHMVLRCLHCRRVARHGDAAEARRRFAGGTRVSVFPPRRCFFAPTATEEVVDAAMRADVIYASGAMLRTVVLPKHRRSAIHAIAGICLFQPLSVDVSCPFYTIKFRQPRRRPSWLPTPSCRLHVRHYCHHADTPPTPRRRRRMFQRHATRHARVCVRRGSMRRTRAQNALMRAAAAAAR